MAVDDPDDHIAQPSEGDRRIRKVRGPEPRENDLNSDLNPASPGEDIGDGSPKNSDSGFPEKTDKNHVSNGIDAGSSEELEKYESKPDPIEKSSEKAMGSGKVIRIPKLLPESESTSVLEGGPESNVKPNKESEPEPKLKSAMQDKLDVDSEKGPVEEDTETHSHRPSDTSKSPGIQQTKSDFSSFPWHAASRDWIICTGIMIALSAFLIFVLVLLDVLKNIMLIGFFGFFITFLLFIAGYFFVQSRNLIGFRATYIGHRRDAEEFTTAYEDALLGREITPIEDAPCVSGHTFGLLSDVRTMKLPDGEIVEINSFHITAGFVLGLYILIRPHSPSLASESPALMLLDSMIRKRSPLFR